MNDPRPTRRPEEEIMAKPPAEAPDTPSLSAPEAIPDNEPFPHRASLLRRKWVIIVGLIASHLLCLAIGWLLPRFKGSGEPSGPGSKPSNVNSYVNSRVGLSPELLQNYVDFSFDYPASWKVIPNAAKGNEKNFIKVERAIPGQKDGDTTTLENFGVGHFTFSAPREQVETQLPEIADEMSNQFARQFPHYQKRSQGPTSINQYRGYEFRFVAQLDVAMTAWGRVVFVLPNGGGGRGATLLMLATSFAPDFSNENDVGVKGELPIILNSFKFGQ